MAIVVVRKRQTGTATVATLSLSGIQPVKGNILVAFLAQSGATAAPTFADNTGSGVWTVQSTHALFSSSLSSIYVATKEANGSESTIETTPATGGTSHAITYFELSGATQTVDAITAKSNVASAATATSEATTTSAGSVILAAAASSASLGETKPWTGTHALERTTEEGSSQIDGGSLVSASALTAETFTAVWTTARASGVLVFALKEAVAGASGNPMTMLV